MIPLLSLWMPIVVSAVLVFAVSSVLHMVFKYHNREYRQLPEEDRVLALLREGGVRPGLYHFPYCADYKDLQDPEMAERWKRGPVGFVTVTPSGLPDMARHLTLWFAFTVVVGVFIAYLAGRTHAPGTSYLSIFRFAGTIAFMTYGLSEVVGSIWKGAPWSATAKSVFDGLLYALVTAGAFGWLWPDA